MTQRLCVCVCLRNRYLGLAHTTYLHQLRMLKASQWGVACLSITQSIFFNSGRCYLATVEVVTGACLCFAPIIVFIPLNLIWQDEYHLRAWRDECACAHLFFASLWCHWGSGTQLLWNRVVVKLQSHERFWPFAVAIFVHVSVSALY